MPAGHLPPLPVGYDPVPHDDGPPPRTGPSPRPAPDAGRAVRRPLGRRDRRVPVVSLGVVALAGLLVPLGLAQRSGAASPESLPASAVTAAQQTLFTPDAAPADPSRQRDLRSVELGVRFAVAAPAEVSGLRYYRTAGDTVAHAATLWSPAGRALATVAFPAARSTGWQYASFGRAVPVPAGSGYTASYHTAVGYAAQARWFERPHPAGGTLGNATGGLYTYSRSTVLPSSSYRATNYWIDVLLAPSGTSATTAPASTSAASSTSATSTSSAGGTTTGSTATSTTVAASTTGNGQPAGGSQPAGETAVPGRVGFLGDRSALRVIDGPATAPPGTTWSNGTLLVSGGGVVLDGVHVKGSIDFSGTGTLTIRNSLVEASGKSWSVVLGRNAAGTLDISDSTIVWPAGVPAPGSSWGNGAVHGDSRMLLVRDDISGTPDGVQQGTGNSLFQQNYIHDLATLPGTHNDGIQLYQGPGVRIIGNYIDLKGYTGTQNAAVFVAHGGNGYDRPQVSGNYLAGGGYQLRLEAGALNATVTDNHFGPLNGGWGEVLVSPGATVAVWSGNVKANGQPLPPP